MRNDDDVAFNGTSVIGDETGELDAGATLQNTMLEGGGAVLFVIFPTTKDGVGSKDGPETFNGTVGVADGAKVVEFVGTVVDGGDVVVTTGGLVGTLEPTIALQFGESKLAQIGVNDAYDDAVKYADI